MLKINVKRPIRRTVIAVIAAVAVLIAAISPIQLLGAVLKGEPLQTPEKVYLGTVNAAKTEKALSTYYTVDTAEGISSYTRTSTGATAAPFSQMGVPVIYGSTYTTFTLEFDYQFTGGKTGEQQIWVLMGITNKTAFSTANGAAAVAIGIGGYTATTTCNIKAIDKSVSNKAVHSTANFDGTAKHHAKITMSDGVMNFIIDGTITATHTVSGYSGGYIGIGTGQKNTVLSDIRVSDTVIPEPEEELPPAEGMDTENIYFGKPTGAKSQGSADKYYTVTEEGGVTQYKRNSTSVSTANSTWQCDTPFISLGEYKNFVLEFDYQYTGKGERYVWINFGNTEKEVYDIETGSAYFSLGIKNAESKETYVNGIYKDKAGGGWFDAGGVGWLDSNGRGSVMDGTAVHHAKITVKDGTLTIDVDNGTCLKKRSLGTAYKGGFVMVGTNYADTVISGLAVMDIDRAGNYSFYKTDDILSGAKTAVGMTDYYQISGSAFTRNGKDKGTETDNVALFGDSVYYTDFDSSFKVQFPDGVGTTYAYMMLGALTSYQSYNDLIETGIQLMSIRQTVTDGGKTVAIRINDGEWSEEFTPETALNEPYELNISVSGTALKVNMGETQMLDFALASKYAGGLVSLGTPNEGVTFSSLSIESTANFDGVFDSYFAPELATENCGGEFSKADFSDYWYTEGGMVVRNGKSTADNHNKNMAVLYIDPNKYNNFELSLRYKTVADRGAYVGFGAEKGKSWWAHTKNPEERVWDLDKGNNIVYLIRSGAVEAGPIKTYIEGSNPSTWWYDTWMTQSGTLFSTTEERESYHTLKIRVENGMMTVWINDNSQGTITLAEYKKGYIYFAASMAGVSFTVPRITDFDNEPEYDFSQYTSYYTEDVADDMEKVDANDYWRINADGNLERKTVTVSDTRDLYDMAYLKVNDTDYTSFTLELDYKHGTSGWGRFFIGFGASEEGKTWHDTAGGLAFTIHTEGIVEYNGNVNDTGKHGSTIFWAIMDDDGNKHQVVPNYKRSAWHHLYMEVAAGICTVRIDDYNWDYELVLPADFDPRNIFIASNSSAAQFRQISITDTSALFPPDTSTGWEPTDEDVYFDFSRRVKNYISIHEYIPSKKIK